MLEWLSSKTLVTRWELYGVFVLIVLTVALGLRQVNHWNLQAQEAADTARQAVFVSSLRGEKVCSESNQGQACRDLFTRLVNNVSAAQRRQLACLIARDLHRPDLADNIDCTGIITRRN